MPFSSYRDNFDSETLAVLEIAFNEAWEVLLASGGDFDPKTTRDALAELIISFAAEGGDGPEATEGTGVGSSAQNARNAIKIGARASG
jgi:hypothetical protein